MVLAFSCKDDEKTESTRKDYSGRGSEACQDWQYAICKFMINKCGVPSERRKQCEDQYGSFECISDQTASSCVESFETASSCDEKLLQQCDWTKIADTQAAIDGCDVLNEAQCEYAIRCDTRMAMEECMDEIESTNDCSTAIGLSASYEECLSAIQDLSCGEPSPPACTRAVYSIR